MISPFDGDSMGSGAGVRLTGGGDGFGFALGGGCIVGGTVMSLPTCASEGGSVKILPTAGVGDAVSEMVVVACVSPTGFTQMKWPTT